MAVNNKMRAVRGALQAASFGHNDRVTCGRTNASFQPYLATVISQPFGASLQILTVLRLGRHAGEADVLAELADKTRLVSFKVLEDRLHGSAPSGLHIYFFGLKS